MILCVFDFQINIVITDDNNNDNRRKSILYNKYYKNKL
jgi:hypothetical protein